ncbi:MAG: orotidine-5'-phosphate decarboxylase [Succinivibrio sp.]|nr:orotidine-5'-phosphate decarboxylase [Succinivibrio sp.]
MPDPKIITALDFQSKSEALNLVKELNPQLTRLKVGNELFTAAGPKLIEELHRLNFEVFLDLKYHDIPNTVKQACLSAAALGVWLLDLHTQGGSVMMREASSALKGLPKAPNLIGVTVLTSLDEAQMLQVGLQASPLEQVLRLALLARDCGLKGVVCSGNEVAAIKAQCGEHFWCVTPGIRPQHSALDDQSRVMTPRQAIMQGADYLVIGRPITRSPDPELSLERISAEVNEALAQKDAHRQI